MSRLSYIGRPWTVFDPKNEDHRRWFAEFQSGNSWSHCPVRFIVSDNHGDLITMIQQQLIEYYTNAEFRKNPQCGNTQNRLTIVKE